MTPIRLGCLMVLALWCVPVGVGGSAPIAAAAEEGETIWGPETDGLRLGVAVAKTAFYPGEPILVRATVANTSSVRRSLPLQDYPPFWIVDVLRLPAEAPVPYTEFGRAVYGLTLGGGGRLAGIKPGQTVDELLCVSWLRDMTLGRGFRIVVAYRVPTRGGEPLVLEAPPLEIEVMQGRPEDAALQELILRPDAGTADLVAARVASSARRFVQGLQDVAAAHPKAYGGQAARAELKRLRADIDTMLSELDKAAPEGAPKPAPLAQEGEEAPSLPPAPAPADQPQEPSRAVPPKE